MRQWSQATAHMVAVNGSFEGKDEPLFRSDLLLIELFGEILVVRGKLTIELNKVAS